MSHTTRSAAIAACALLLLSACTTKGADSSANQNAAATGPATASGGVVELKDGAKVKLALVPGGAHPYFQPWKTAGEQAKTELGLGGFTFNETGEWDQGKQNAALESLAAQGYNAFGVFGVSPADINTTFADLQGKGFAVGSLASCPAGDVNEAAFCLSTDTEQAAYKAAKAAIEAMGGKGALAHLTGNNVDSNTQRRIAGVKKAIDETGGAVTLAHTVTDIDSDLQTATKAVTDLLNAHGKSIQGIVSTAYNPAVAAAGAVKGAGLPIKVVAIDDDAKILAGIKDGSVAATVTQNPGGQASVGSWVLALLASGQCQMKAKGAVVDSGSFVVTKANVDSYDKERVAKSDEVKQQFATQLLSCS